MQNICLIVNKISEYFNFKTKENKNAIHKPSQIDKGNFMAFIHDASHGMIRQ